MNQRPDVDVAMTLSYYAPYVSELTDSARLVAEGLTTRGWGITVLTARHDPALRTRENLAGVTVVRTPVAAGFVKGAAKRGRTEVVSPPCQDRRGGNPTFQDGTGLHVGFLGRIVEEKGLEYLIDGFLRVARVEDRLLVGGDLSNVAGGSGIEKMRTLAGLDPRIRFLGFLPESAQADFYASLDVFGLPSVNSLEALGIGQVEAMMTGVPAIASDLPGVRAPVLRTGFGILVPTRSADAIGAAITHLRANPPGREAGASHTRQRYGAPATIDEYEAISRELGAHPSPNA